MKKEIQISILTLILVISSCKKLQYLNKFYGYKSNPKYIQIDRYKFKEKVKEFSGRTILEFDKKGRTKIHKWYRSDTLLTGGMNYKYDKSGNIISIQLLNGDGSVNVNSIYKFNKMGQEVLWEHISEDKKSLTESKYDKNGNLSESISKYADGEFKSRFTIEYDSKGRKSIQISYDLENKEKSKIIYIYNEVENRKESHWYNSKGIHFRTFETTYNSNGNRIKIDRYSLKNDVIELKGFSQFKYKYDGEGNIIEKQTLHDGELEWQEEIKIDYWK